MAQDSDNGHDGQNSDATADAPLTDEFNEQTIAQESDANFQSAADAVYGPVDSQDYSTEFNDAADQQDSAVESRDSSGDDSSGEDAASGSEQTSSADSEPSLPADVDAMYQTTDQSDWDNAHDHNDDYSHGM